MLSARAETVAKLIEQARSETAQRAYTEQSIENLSSPTELLIPEHPEVPRIKNMLTEDVDAGAGGLAHERNFLHTLRNDPEFRKALGEPGGLNEGIPEDYVNSKLSKIRQKTGPSRKSGLGPSLPQADGAAAEPSPAAQEPDHSQDMYTLIHKIQSEIIEHEKLVARLQARQNDYAAMKDAYEQKLTNLQSQLIQVQQERDEALGRIRGDTKTPVGERDRGAAAVKARYEEQKRKLEQEIQEYKKKLNDNGRLQSSSKSRSEGLTKGLRETIESLKAEKAQIMRDLKREADKNKALHIETQKELQRREVETLEMKKKLQELEKSHEMQTIILRRRSEEIRHSKSKLKKVLTMLKRTESRPGSRQGSASSRLRQGWFDDQSGEDLTGRLSNPLNGDLDEYENMPPLAIRARFKKQLLEQEMACAISARRAAMALDELYEKRDRLLGEQRELLAERERVVLADSEATGLPLDPQKPQYMDDRLWVLDHEIAMVNSRILAVEEERGVQSKPSAPADSSAQDEESIPEERRLVWQRPMRRPSSPMVPSALDRGNELGSAAPEADGVDQTRHQTLFMEDVNRCRTQDTEKSQSNAPPASLPLDTDQIWDNIVNFLHSLESEELSLILELYLEDIIQLRMFVRDEEYALNERDRIIAELKSSIDTIQHAARQAAVDYEGRIQKVQEEDLVRQKKAVQVAVEKALQESRQSPRISVSTETDQPIEEVADENELTDQDLEVLRIIKDKMRLSKRSSGKLYVLQNAGADRLPRSSSFTYEPEEQAEKGSGSRRQAWSDVPRTHSLNASGDSLVSTSDASAPRPPSPLRQSFKHSSRDDLPPSRALSLPRRSRIPQAAGPPSPRIGYASDTSGEDEEAVASNRPQGTITRPFPDAEQYRSSNNLSPTRPALRRTPTNPEEDVFRRLASAHTLASQAKMIHRPQEMLSTDELVPRRASPTAECPVGAAVLIPEKS
ncbi:uncharacterized protein BJ171DRAFT_73533 [Polychytrium aggregatum]|uniref:uncharacterized protein n=1 Tax=Polychytrium aggregatum TaxID=110093 RepID=UPI0022FE0F13|nr:uncharacterized protein BJ171DRAFT_73533 [Polychytrium aggregatum]KAI9205434.1 hypothetical protein BJ171DRAFT_73533 [Polychytrium aggregatum]